jgi:adenine-specific DNA-methyltransferase
VEIQEQLFYDSHERAVRYLRDIPPDDRRAAGQVYTPPHLVAFVLERAGYEPRASLEALTLLDPACGCGVFLERAVDVLAARLAGAGVDPTSSGGRKRLVEAVSRSIYGVDVDARACELARRALRSAVAAATSSLLPADSFDENIVKADFLLSDEPSRLPPVQNGGFDLIVGNPPYVSATRLDHSYKLELRSALESASGRLDLYTLFIERALSLLRAGGHVAFITPDKFLVSQSARSLRSLVARRDAVRSIARFPSHKVFDDAATVPCVTVIERGGLRASDGDDVEILECADEPTRAGEVRVIGSWHVPRRSLTPAGWRLSPPHLVKLEDRIGAGHRTLEDVSERVSAGLATGRDALYVLPDERALTIEDELLRPAVRGRDLSPYRIADPGLRILVPYTYDDRGRPQLVDLEAYPDAHRYLDEHRRVLEQRHCVRKWRKTWYDLHDPVSVDLALRPKILVPDVAYASRFAFDEGRYVPLHSTYYIVPRSVDPHFLTALLNSKPLEFLIRLRAPKVKDGFSRYRKQFLTGLPVPPMASRDASRIAEAGASGDHERVDELVSNAFGLAARELDAIRDYLGPTSHLVGAGAGAEAN